MDIEKIRSELGRNSGYAGWLLTRMRSDATTVIRLPWIVTVADGRFVQEPNPHARESIRAPSEEVWLSIYSRHERDGEPLMGEAKGQLLSDDPPAVRRLVEELLEAARRQANRPYAVAVGPLTYPDVALCDPEIAASDHAALLSRVQRFGDTILRFAESEASVQISNLEIFVGHSVSELASSSGLAHTYEATRADAEISLIARLADGRMAEHTARPKARRLTDLDPADLVRRNAEYARAIASAGAPPSWDGPVVMDGDAVAEVLSLDAGPLRFHASAAAVHDKMSRYARGEPVSGRDAPDQEHFTISSDPLIPFGSRSVPLSSADGNPARAATLVRDGCWEEVLGSRRYYDYLGWLDEGLEPTGPMGNTVVGAGSHSASELLDAGKVVVVRSLSDFGADPTSGDFACEIRLGAIRENGVEVPFKGGLLVGNYFDALAHIALSSEVTVRDHYYGPAVARFGSLKVAG